MANDQLPNVLATGATLELTAGFDDAAVAGVSAVLGVPVASSFAALITEEAAELAAGGVGTTLVDVLAVVSSLAEDAAVTGEELAFLAVLAFLVCEEDEDVS